MIQANELRIGNWVQDPDRAILDENEGYRQVHGLTLENSIVHHVAKESSSGGIGFSGNLLSTINPIPLTPEILEQCGFRNDHGEGSKWWMRPDLKHSFGLGDYNEDFSELTFSKHPLNTKIKYLHQLQNLYFALVGKELEITLTKNPT